MPKPQKSIPHPSQDSSSPPPRSAAIMDPVTSGGVLSYPDSVDSSPRSRGGESWDEPFPSSAAASRLRLMCSYGGRIVPRPTDKSLCYLGGDTRIVVVDRLSSLSDLHSKLSRSILDNCPFTLKYQLPNEDLDSLISVTTEEDFENMIEEYDRISAAAAANPKSDSKSSRIRLFLFPTKPESAPSSIGSLLDDSKSETWFVDALNGAMGVGVDGFTRDISTDSASVNCLLGLEDDSSVHSRNGVGPNTGGAGGDQPDLDRMGLIRPDSSGKLAGRNGQDVQSVPDSPMMDKNSSFGSTSSAPTLSNLPPIRVRPHGRSPDQRYGNLDDHFQQMNLGYAQQNQQPLNPPQPIQMQTAAVPTATISTAENPNTNRFGSDDDKPDIRKQKMQMQQQQQQVVNQQQKPLQAEAPIPDSRPAYYQEAMPQAPVNLESKREIPVSDPATTYRMQQVPMPVPEPGYALPMIPAPEQFHPHAAAHPLAHMQQQQPQQPVQQPQQLQPVPQQPQPQQQFIPANPHYAPIQSYYQIPHPMQQSQPYDPSIPMYYIPVRQNPPPVSALPVPKVALKPELQPNLYRTAAPPGPMMHVAAPGADQGHGPAAYTGMSYHVMHHHQAPADVAQQAAMANYGYEYSNANDMATSPDTMRPGAQVYYTQATSQPTMQAQYQTVTSTPQTMPAQYLTATSASQTMPVQYQTVISEAGQQTVELKQNRAS